MSDFLGQMAASSLKRAQQAEQALPADQLLKLQGKKHPPKPFVKPDGRIGIIAECKRVAPSAGVLATNVNVASRISAYARAGASAISVLTEPDKFGGSIDDLRLATSATQTPVMRKDFLINQYQVLEARAAGASGVLLIAAILPGSELVEMLHCAQQLGMFALVEAFDEADVEHSLNAGAEIVGVNCRNLRTLEVEFSRFEKLASLLDNVTSVAESGITNAQELTEVESLGYDFALIGSVLMKQANPEQALRDLLQPGASHA